MSTGGGSAGEARHGGPPVSRNVARPGAAYIHRVHRLAIISFPGRGSNFVAALARTPVDSGKSRAPDRRRRLGQSGCSGPGDRGGAGPARAIAICEEDDALGARGSRAPRPRRRAPRPDLCRPATCGESARRSLCRGVPPDGYFLNIHPSLPPKYPGRSTSSVAHSQDRQSASRGCASVHYVDVGIDSGPILLQRRVPILPGDTGGRALSARTLEEGARSISGGGEPRARRARKIPGASRARKPHRFGRPADARRGVARTVFAVFAESRKISVRGSCGQALTGMSLRSVSDGGRKPRIVPDSGRGGTYYAFPFTGQALFITWNLGAKLAPAALRLMGASAAGFASGTGPESAREIKALGNDFH